MLSKFLTDSLTCEESVESRQIAPLPVGSETGDGVRSGGGGQTVLLGSPGLQLEESHGEEAAARPRHQTVDHQLGRDVRLLAGTETHHLAQHAQYDEEGPGAGERERVAGQTDLPEVVSHPLQPGPHYDGPQQSSTAREEVEGERAALVLTAASCQPALPSPQPMGGRREDDAGEEEGDDQVTRQVGSL